MHNMILAFLLLVTGCLAGCADPTPPEAESGAAPFHSTYSREPYVESGAYRSLKGR
jgi:hypothetical protein